MGKYFKLSKNAKTWSELPLNHSSGVLQKEGRQCIFYFALPALQMTKPCPALHSAADKAGAVLITAIGQGIVNDLCVHAHSKTCFGFPLLHTLTTSITESGPYH